MNILEALEKAKKEQGMASLDIVATDKAGARPHVRIYESIYIDPAMDHDIGCRLTLSEIQSLGWKVSVTVTPRKKTVRATGPRIRIKV